MGRAAGGQEGVLGRLAGLRAVGELPGDAPVILRASDALRDTARHLAKDQPCPVQVVDGAGERADRGAARGEKIGGGNRRRLEGRPRLSGRLAGGRDLAGAAHPGAWCAHRRFEVRGARWMPGRPSSPPAEMRGADFASALDGFHQSAELALDVTFVAADMDDCHAAWFAIFDGRQFG